MFPSTRKRPVTEQHVKKDKQKQSNKLQFLFIQLND